MDELKRAAAVLGKKGGQAKVPKGFAKSGKAREAGKKTALKRWGKVMDVTVRVRWLPLAEKNILSAVSHVTTEPTTNVREAITWLVALKVAHQKDLEDLGVDIHEFHWSQPKKTELNEGRFKWFLDHTPINKNSFPVIEGKK